MLPTRHKQYVSTRCLLLVITLPQPPALVATCSLVCAFTYTNAEVGSLHACRHIIRSSHHLIRCVCLSRSIYPSFYLSRVARRPAWSDPTSAFV